MTGRVVILAKAPVPGLVKTRLATDIGDQAAAALHRVMSLHAVRRAGQSGLEVVVALEPAGASEDLLRSFRTELEVLGARVIPQAGGDLGARMAAALRGPRRAVALGIDCPLFQPAWLTQAVGSRAPLALGPAEDGGYWTISVDPAVPEAWRLAFDDVPWSTPDVLDLTVRRARAAGLAVDLLPTCYDIDDKADLDRLLADPRCPAALRERLGDLLGR